MAFIGESKERVTSPWRVCVCLDKEDCELLSQVTGSLVARKLRTYEYYKGIHEGGEATEKQVDKMWAAEKEFDVAKNIEQVILEFLKLGKDAK